MTKGGQVVNFLNLKYAIEFKNDRESGSNSHSGELPVKLDGLPADTYAMILEIYPNEILNIATFSFGANKVSMVQSQIIHAANILGRIRVLLKIAITSQENMNEVAFSVNFVSTRTEETGYIVVYRQRGTRYTQSHRKYNH